MVAVLGGGVAALALGAWVAATGGPDAAQVDWIEATAITFETVEAENGFDDLHRLKEIIGDARIVALGEGTHGTREFFQMKHRLTEFLASEMGFTIFSIEANMPEAYRVNDYVLGGAGDPKELIAGMYFWTWNTHEVLEMVEWMRRFNVAGTGRIEFTGFDMQSLRAAIPIVEEFVRRHEPEWLADLHEIYGKARRAPSAGAAAFGVVTGTFPVEAAAGKKLRYSGWIKTSGLKEGRARLWWRVDGPNGVLAFDTMRDRGPKGDSPWKDYEIELEIPAEVTNIDFGVMMPGVGAAWFDELRVELDGVEYKDTDLFDFDFEGDTIQGFFAQAPGYEATLDAGEATSGKQSLRLMKISRAAERGAERGVTDAAQASHRCREVRERLEAGRPRYLEQADAKDVEWAIQNACIVEQALQHRASQAGFFRDVSMAKNVCWILEQNPGAKIILWAHNSHVGKTPSAMGYYRRRNHGDDYLAIGFATSRGTYFAVGDDMLGVHKLRRPPRKSIERYLQAVGEPRLILDVRRAAKGSAESGWLCENRPFRSIGGLAKSRQFRESNMRELFDVLVYVEDTTAAVQIAR